MSFRFVNCDAIFFLKIWSKFDLNLIWPLPNRNFESHTRYENPNSTILFDLGLKESIFQYFNMKYYCDMIYDGLEHFFGLNLINFKCQSYCVIDRINIYVKLHPTLWRVHKVL